MAFAPPPPPPSNFPHSNPSNPSPGHPSRILLPNRRRRTSTLPFALPSLPKPNTVLLSDVRVIDKKHLPESVVEEQVAPLLHKKVRPEQIDQAVDRINKWYTTNGYVCSKLLVLQSPGWNQSKLVLYCVEPLLAGIRLISVDKNGKETPDVPIITRELTIINIIGGKIGKVFRWDPVRFNSLMSLALFEYAQAELNTIDPRKVELVLRVCERQHGRIEPGAGITSDGRVYGNISVVDNNFRGQAQRIRFEWQKKIDSGRSSGGIAFEDKRLGADIPISFTARAYRDSNSGRSIPVAGAISRAANAIANCTLSHAEATDAQSQSTLTYEKDRDGAMVELAYQPRGKQVMFSVIPMLEFVHSMQPTSNNSTPQFVLQTSCMHVTGKGVANPRDGHLLRVEHSMGKILLDDQSAFHKTYVRLAKYFGIGPHASVAVGGSLGFGSQNLPWHEQKSLGGYGSVRGYNYGELGRFKSYGIGRVELRVPLTAPQSGSEETQDDIATSKDDQVAEGKPAETPAAPKRGIIPAGMFQNVPSLVGVLFKDVAAIDSRTPEVLGHNVGLGLRIGGVIALEWTQIGEGKGSRLNFGLVDQFL